MIPLVVLQQNVVFRRMLFDSTGTKKIAAIASYVIEALEQGRILVVDELDSSIHFKLTRAIVAMFNNELNTGAQNPAGFRKRAKKAVVPEYYKYF